MLSYLGHTTSYLQNIRIERWKTFIYILVCISVFPILLFRDFTPGNELRYLSIVDEALRNGSIFTFTNHGIPYADKPPLYFWGLMLCRMIAGNHYMWLMALLSLIPGLITLNVMDKWTTSVLDITDRKRTFLVLLTCAFFIGSMVVLRMDMLMTMFIVLALRSFFILYHYKNEPDYQSPDSHTINNQKWLFGIWLFLALFSKGPLGILIPLFSSIVFLIINGKFRQIFHYWGWRTWLVLISLCTVWFGAVYMEGGTSYLDNLLFHQTIDRAVNSFHHDRPFWYYCIAIWYILAPWCLLIIGLLFVAVKHWKECSLLQQFFLTVSITTFILLSCISAKLQVYMLPAVPFLAYGAMMSFSKFRHNVWIRVAIGVPAAIYILALPIYFVALYILDLSLLKSPFFGISASILTIAGCIALYYISHKTNQSPSKYIYPISLGLLLALFAAGWGIPSINDIIGYRALCTKALEISEKSNNSDIYVWRISRPENMDVFLHRDIIEIPKDSVERTSSINKGLLLMPAAKYHKLSIPNVSDTTHVGKYVIVNICPK